MPTYTYQCELCGEFDRQQPISEPALERCPQCGKAVKRMISGGTGFILKGRGAFASNCGNESPCCGRETRCEKPPCSK